MYNGTLACYFTPKQALDRIPMNQIITSLFDVIIIINYFYTQYMTDAPIKLKPIDPSSDEVQHIYTLLESITIPFNSNKTGRARTFGDHRAMTLGFVKARITREFGLSRCSKKYPELYNAVKEFGETIFPFPFTSIHINHNVVCPRHLDSENVGNSMLVSFGDYEGCDLVIEHHGTFNTNCQPVIFNGSKHYHFNTPLKNGNKYSLVFFNTQTTK